MRYFLLFLLFMILSSWSNKSDYDNSTKNRIANELSNMMTLDQKYRWHIMYGEVDEKKLDSLKKLPDNLRYAIFAKMNTSKYGLTKKQTDSIWKLQSYLDSLNEKRLSQIIDSFEFPSNILIGVDYAEAIILHFSKPFVKKYYPLMMNQAKEKRLSPDAVAQMYDKYMLSQGLKQVYGSMGDINPQTGQFEAPMIEDIEITNKLRIEIGLDSLRDYRIIKK